MDGSGDGTKCTSQIDLMKLADGADVGGGERKAKRGAPEVVLAAGW